ncbi:MAG: type III polyketide synthase [Deltaproteobacteria bacterium]|nr:type III polyketide synthase [Deltaproteobacteria bacterium]
MPRREHSLGAVLAGFRPVELQPPLPQRWLLDHTAHLMAVSRCARDGLHDDRSFQLALDDVRKQVQRYGVSPEIIAQRQATVLPAFEPGKVPEHALHGIFGSLREKPAGPGLDVRLARYRELVDAYLAAHYPASLAPPDDLIHVSTTGYLLPSPVQRAVAARGWSTVVTHSYHMGCYGAFPAVRTAVGLLAAGQLGDPPKTRVDLVHAEAASLHLDPTLATPGNLVTSTLFGDGFITYSALTEAHARANGVHGLRVVAMHESLIPDSAEDMKLTPGPHQFDMHLSLRVPIKIRDGILPFVRELCRKGGRDFDAEREQFTFAIHAGGTKILQVAAEALGVDLARMEHGTRVLREHGNMASATVPYIWNDVVNDARIAPGTPVISASFGPGLTVTGALLEKI